MKIVFTFPRFLTGMALGAMLLPVFLSPKTAYAEDYTRVSTSYLVGDRQYNSAMMNSDRNYQMGLMLNYLRQQAPSLVPGLPDMLRGPVHFLIGQGHSSGDDRFDFAGGDTVSSFLSLISPTDINDQEALRLSPDYHHMHGMLPFDDAVILGFNYHNAISDNQLRFDVHPYYAQSWHGMDGYWGLETALNLGPDAAHPLAKLVVRYDNGNSDIMDQQRGLDVHADYSFDDHLTFSAGAQNENDALGNYVLMRWKMEFGK